MPGVIFRLLSSVRAPSPASWTLEASNALKNQENLMETGRNNNRPLGFMVIALIAIAAFGLGVATMFVMNQVAPASPGITNPQAGTVNGGANSGETPLQRPNVPEDVNEQFDSFWKTFEAINEEYYDRPIDRQKLIHGATKGLVESLGDDFSS